jgi:hypothetical protein
VSTFEKLATSLSFLGCTEGRTFEYLSRRADGETVSVERERETKEDGGSGDEEGDEVMGEGAELEEEEEYGKGAEELSEEDSGSDIEIISSLKITDDVVSLTYQY